MGFREFLNKMVDKAKRRRSGEGGDATAEQRGEPAPDQGVHATAEQRSEESETLDIAREIIKQARKSGNNQIDLGEVILLKNWELEVLLKENEAMLGNVSHLVLNGNRLTAPLPEKMRLLKNLQYLDLSNNNLQTVPPELAALKKLQHLDLSYNQLETVPPIVYKMIEHQLTGLLLQHNSIESFGDNAYKLLSLHTLNFANNPGTNELLKAATEAQIRHDFAAPQYQSYDKVLPQIYTDNIDCFVTNEQIDLLQEKFHTALGNEMPANQVIKDFLAKMPIYETQEVRDVYQSSVQRIIGTLLADDAEVQQDAKTALLERMASCLEISPIAVNTFIVHEAIAYHTQNQLPIPTVLDEMIKREAVEKMLLEEFAKEFDSAHPQSNYRDKLAGVIFNIYPQYLGESDHQHPYRLPSKGPDINAAFDPLSLELVLKAAQKICMPFDIDENLADNKKPKLELDDAKIKEITEAYLEEFFDATSLQAQSKNTRGGGGVLEKKGGKTEPQQQQQQQQPYKGFYGSLAEALPPLQPPQSPSGRAEAKKSTRGQQSP